MVIIEVYFSHLQNIPCFSFSLSTNHAMSDLRMNGQGGVDSHHFF